MVIAGEVRSIETAWVDLGLASLRQRDHSAEMHLLESIRTHAIKEPLLVVATQPQRYTLLDGFKRYRCACRLKIGIIPVLACEGQEKDGILALLRLSHSRGLSDLEHGALLDRLHTHHGMSVVQIASHLGCSTGWVGVRLGMVSQMSELVRRKVLSGQFPARAYLYCVRPFTRVNDAKSILVDRFVGAVSGRDLSTRDIFILTKAYFTGGRCIRQRIDDGNVKEVLEAIKDDPAAIGATVVDSITSTKAELDRFIARATEVRLDDETAALRTHLACAALLRCIGPFTLSVKELYGRTTKALGGDGAVERGQEQEADSAAA
jgi:hypothetical protein